MDNRYYITYGLLMSFAEMQKVCMTARHIGSGVIRHCSLDFRGELALPTLVPSDGAAPVAVYAVSFDDEIDLDNKFPSSMYCKVQCTAVVDGKEIQGYTHVIKDELPRVLPTQEIKNIMKEGYSDNGLGVSDWDSRFF